MTESAIYKNFFWLLFNDISENQTGKVAYSTDDFDIIVWRAYQDGGKHGEVSLTPLDFECLDYLVKKSGCWLDMESENSSNEGMELLELARWKQRIIERENDEDDENAEG
jgi:hypothetical protein